MATAMGSSRAMPPDTPDLQKRPQTDPGYYNPFTLLPDEELFRLAAQEKTLRQAAARAQAKLPVAERTTYSSRMHSVVSPDALGLAATLALLRHEAPRPQTSLAEATAPKRRWVDKENVHELVAKKREMFLVQMALDTRRAEIAKLEDRAAQREEALQKSEAMLEEDAVKFDNFLKENDEKVQEALLKADAEAKSRQEKVSEIKRVNASIATLKSELNKFEEQMEDCRKYKTFLLSVTPEEHFAELREKAVARRQQKLNAWQAQCDAIRKQKADAKAARAKAEADYSNASTQQEAERTEQAMRAATAALREISKLKEPPPPADQPDTQDNDELYFQHPSQLLEIFSSMEEGALFLIQHVQAMEEGLEELRARFASTKESMDDDARALRGQVTSLQQRIRSETEKCRALRERVGQRYDSSRLTGNKGMTLEEAAAKIRKVYMRCGFDADASMSTVQMLTNLETKLEEYLSVADGMSKDVVDAGERSRERERRQTTREEKAVWQKQEHEARVNRALERAAAPAFRKVGKPIMFRSHLVRRKKVDVGDRWHDEEMAELHAFLARPD